MSIEVFCKKYHLFFFSFKVLFLVSSTFLTIVQQITFHVIIRLDQAYNVYEFLVTHRDIHSNPQLISFFFKFLL